MANEQLLTIARQLCDTLLDEEVELGLLQTYTPKNHQVRYTLNMAGYIGLMVAERISARGGVEELLHLLSDTAQRIERGEISEDVVAEQLIEARRTLIGLANELHRRRHTETLRELAAHARDHDAEQITAQVSSLNVLVAKHFPALSERGTALIRAAQFYTRELEAVTVKLVTEGAASRDFTYRCRGLRRGRAHGERRCAGRRRRVTAVRPRRGTGERDRGRRRRQCLPAADGCAHAAADSAGLHRAR